MGRWDAAIGLALLLATPALGQTACQSFVASAGESTVDLAPPAGFVEVCARDAALCQKLTSGYPPSVQTLAYFAASPEWAAYRIDSSKRFEHYLIAQFARDMRPAALPDFKAYVHNNNGSIPDHTQLPAVLESQGRASLGVVDETDSSISFGTLIRVRSSADPRPPATLAGINTVVVLHGRVFSLYAFGVVKDSTDIRRTEDLSQGWLACLRKRGGIRKH
jgi:hypothetical protein